MALLKVGGHKEGTQRDYVFLVLGVRCWGKGDSEKYALKVAKKEGGSTGTKDYNVYLAPPSVYVNPMGGIEWKKEEGKPDNIILIKCVRGGKEVPITDKE